MSDVLALIRDWVEQRTGIVYPKDKESTLPARLASFGARQNLTPHGIWERLQSGDYVVAVRLAEAVSTNHTQFFREPEAFDALRELIYPRLPANQELRLWSAAASSGEEAYSIAICLKQATLGVDFHRIKILGTDISKQQINSAEKGAYPLRSLGHLSPEQMLFFTVRDDVAQVHPEIKSACVFRLMNLVQFPWPFERRFHVIFLRNVLYYFSPALRGAVLDACYEAAEPGGWLVTSTTEPLFGIRSPWMQQRAGLYRKP